MLPVCALAIMALPVLLQYGHWDWLWTIWFYLLSPEVQQLDVIWLYGTKQEHKQMWHLLKCRRYISINMMHNCLNDFHKQTGKLQSNTHVTTLAKLRRHSIMEYATFPNMPLDIPSKLPSSTWECYSVKGHCPIHTLSKIIQSSLKQNTFQKLSTLNSFDPNLLQDCGKS
jgi:hypothetical protein